MKTKRWRSYHRALKRQESWAIHLSTKNETQKALTRYYAGVMLDIIHGVNPFTKLLQAKSDWLGAYIPLSLVSNSKRKRSAYRHK